MQLHITLSQQQILVLVWKEMCLRSDICHLVVHSCRKQN